MSQRKVLTYWHRNVDGKRYCQRYFRSKQELTDPEVSKKGSHYEYDEEYDKILQYSWCKDDPWSPWNPKKVEGLRCWCRECYHLHCDVDYDFSADHYNSTVATERAGRSAHVLRLKKLDNLLLSHALARMGYSG
jgi:hypothetical protein